MSGRRADGTNPRALGTNPRAGAGTPPAASPGGGGGNAGQEVSPQITGEKNNNPEVSPQITTTEPHATAIERLLNGSTVAVGSPAPDEALRGYPRWTVGEEKKEMTENKKDPNWSVDVELEKAEDWFRHSL
mgnify:CR=1 FL=1